MQMTTKDKIIFSSDKSTVKEKAEVCQKYFGFVASCKDYFTAKDIMLRLKRNDVEARIETITDELFNVVMG